MKTWYRGVLRILIAGFVTSAAPTALAHGKHRQAAGGPALPVVFVHGFSGSGQQYEAQALRWASNDYPNLVTAVDRLFEGFTLEQLDAFFDDVLARTGAEKLYAVGHSAGTAVMTSYLDSSPERAARVAKYIGIDGASNETCPGGVDSDGNPNVPCMGIWGRGSTERKVGPDHNIYLSEHGHTQTVTSAQSFAAQYEFLTGRAPKSTLILPERPHGVEISGRALNFPLNTGIEGAELELWEVNPLTGERVHAAPDTQETVDTTGNFGPWQVDGRKRYEINVIRQAEDGPRFQHFYFEPWIRSDHLVRLNISPIGSTLSDAIRENSGSNAGASVVRQKEWWGDNDVDPDNVDVLEVTTSVPAYPSSSFGRTFCRLLGHEAPNPCAVEEVGDIATPGTAPYASSTIAMIAFDIAGDGASDTSALVSLGPFLSGIDAFMPAPDPEPNGVVTFHLKGRREVRDQVINTPNWPMRGNHFMTVMFREWTQLVDSWLECRATRLCR